MWSRSTKQRRAAQRRRVAEEWIRERPFLQADILRQYTQPKPVDIVSANNSLLMHFLQKKTNPRSWNVNPRLRTASLRALKRADAGLTSALRLLGNLATQAAHSTSSDNYVDMDDCLIRLKALLPELFACRTVGDGFGMIINAVFWAITKRQTRPFLIEEVEVLAQTIQTLREEPMLGASKASRLIDALEDSGLDVEPFGIGYPLQNDNSKE
jgi:hypothetical protein